MNPAILSQNENVVPSLFQIAAYFDDFFSATGLKKPAPKLSRMPFADLMLHPKKLAAVLESAKTKSDTIATPRTAMPSPVKRSTPRVMSKKRDGNLAGRLDGHSSSELRKVEFTLEATAAGSVKLAGDFTDWEKGPVEMMHSPDGVWFTIVQLAPGSYSYRFIVDAQWRDDPRCTRCVPNPFGSHNAMIEVT